MRAINTPPSAPSLMWSTRAIGYTTPAAVADLIDNSISAGATHIDIEFVSGDDSYVSIIDDGKGMNSNELRLAMRYGSSNPLDVRESGDLGRFGLGMKTASLSQCRKLTVASKKNGVVSAYCWDLDHILSVESWELLEMDDSDIAGIPQIEKLYSYTEGTIVLWNELDKIFAGDEDKEKGLLLRIKEVEEHLAITFHRFLQGEPGIKKINIKSNGIDIKPVDPFYISKSDELPTETVPVKYVREDGSEGIENVAVTPYILPFPDSLTQEEIDSLGGKDGLIKGQGFYIYRNKRLIVAADWFRLVRKTDLTKLCRVKVDIPNSLDDIWTIDVKKSMAVPPEIVLRNMKRIVAPIVKTGKRKYKFRATKETSKDTMQIWVPAETRNGIVYNINTEYPIYKELMNDIQDNKKFQTFIRLIEQNIPVNAIHTDFYEDKKYAFEDVDEALENVKTNLRDLLKEIRPEEQEEAFKELMSVMPFAEYELTIADLGEI